MQSDNIIRFVVATDSHLGFAEKDPVRCQDSFAAFEEVLRTAVQKNADFILFAGDMFHENKPSRRTMHSTMELLRHYCFGSRPVFIEVLNDQEDIFKSTMGRVNYEDPFQSVSMPIFAIHGNHDDPSREGTSGDALAALDLLAVSNMINYFGKAERVEDIEIMPILIRKGSTKIALYGLGAVRDERLNRMWNQKKVKFVRLTEDQGRDEFFNIFLLHQNRDYGRGRKNCVHESMIPEWMDLVIWGNEHECQPQLMESLVGTYRILQPGSSIACSLSRSESDACPKHMSFFEVRDRQFRIKPIRFREVRSFIYDELVLTPCLELNPNDPDVEKKISLVLATKIRSMIEEAHSSALAAASNESTELAPPRFQLLQRDKPLIRLRVQLEGFATINQQRFGSQFIDSVANPSELLLLARKRQETGSQSSRGALSHGNIRQIFAEGAQEEIDQIKIEELIKDALNSSSHSLSVLMENDMAKALDDFILRKDGDAIRDSVAKSLRRVQLGLSKDLNVNKVESVAEGIARVRQQLISAGPEASTTSNHETIRRSTDLRATVEEPMAAAYIANAAKRSVGKSRATAAGRGKSRSKAASESASTTGKPAAKRSAKKKVQSSSEDIDTSSSDPIDLEMNSEDEDEAISSMNFQALKPSSTRGSKKHLSARATNDDNDVEFLGVTQSASTGALSSRRQPLTFTPASSKTKMSHANWDE